MSTVDPTYQQAIATLRSGGTTVPALPGRYVVAVGKPYERVTPQRIDAIASALTDLSLTRAAQGRSLGTWVNPDDGMVYVDVVESFTSKAAAMRAARSRAQLAVYDARADVAITVPKPRVRQSDSLDSDVMAARLINLYYDADDKTRRQGAEWYPSAGDVVVAWSIRYGVTVEAVAAVIAATSPQTRWQDNLRDAEYVLSGKDRRPGVMSENLARARRVLAADDPVDELRHGSKSGKLGGPKMHAFALNILGDTHAVTVDVWATRAALGLTWRVTEDSDRAARVLGWVGAYDRIADAYRKAAAAVGIAAPEFQATVWIAVRGKAA